MDSLQKNLDNLKNYNDSKEILTRIFKYLIQGIAIAIAAFIIPDVKLQPFHILLISLTGASAFAIIDLAIPSILVNK
tara:strand:+ start:1324 stop:1554 length:231 start_codon:yes stop_codon:yes gene_type:complete